MQPVVLDREIIGDLFRQIDEVSQHLVEHPKTGMLMVLVPAGRFLTDSQGDDPSEVDLSAYYVGVHPVTNAEYARFVSETGHRKPEQADWSTPVWRNGRFPPEKAEHPVVCVNQKDATAYCSWAGLRLPTALEWEKAARGLDGRTYPWGRDWDPNRCRNSPMWGGETTANVWRYGQGASPFGGYQLCGNVWEWCSDSNSLVRGGAWTGKTHEAFRASFSRHLDPQFLAPVYGFRCVSRVGSSPGDCLHDIP